MWHFKNEKKLILFLSSFFFILILVFIISFYLKNNKVANNNVTCDRYWTLKNIYRKKLCLVAFFNGNKMWNLTFNPNDTFCFLDHAMHLHPYQIGCVHNRLIFFFLSSLPISTLHHMAVAFASIAIRVVVEQHMI